VEFENQTVLITGGGGGIGSALAKAFAVEGAAVVVADLILEAAHRVAHTLQTEGHKALALAGDVSSEEDCRRLVASSVSAFGSLDILVNNAGIGGPVAAIADMDCDDWDRTLAVNVTGAMLMSREALRVMLPQRRGAIVNVASNVGKRGTPYRGPYVASKFAMIGLTQTLALEVATHGIRVNAVCPGPVAGERIERYITKLAEVRNISPDVVREEWLRESPMRRMVTAEEVAAVVLFLASSRGSAMTGQAINVTAGRVMY